MNDIFDVLIVGGALSGSRTAQLISNYTKNILLIEDNKNIGYPCKCTGLVSWRIKKYLPFLPKKIIINTINKASFNSPDGTNFILKSKNPVYVIDRPGLDKYIYNMAKESGIKIKNGEKFISYKLMEEYVKVFTNKNVYKTKILIGADGASSSVGKSAGLKYPEKYLIGVQTTTLGKFDNIELWFGSKISPSFFAWVVPENKNIARIGLATYRKSGNYYEDFLKKRIGKFEKPNVGGIIRFGIMEKTSSERVMVVGDAACQVKPYSGGGIIFSLISAKICANAAIKSLKEEKFDYKFFFDNYDKVWKKKIGNAIKRGLFLSKILSSRNFLINKLFKIGKIFSRFLNKIDMDLINIFI